MKEKYEETKACKGCVHEQRNRSSFPCDECKRALKGEHDMYVEKTKEK